MIFDGGFGSQLFVRGIELANSALANELYPEAVTDVHLQYILAGSDAIETNTFVASFPHLEMAGKDASGSEDLVRRSVVLAREAIDRGEREVYLGGSIGPLPGAVEADSGDTDFGIANSICREAHQRVADTLAQGGIDFFCLETMFSAKEAAMAVDVIRKFDIPIAVNLTYKYTRDRKTGDVIYKTDWGHSASDLLDILSSGEFSEGIDLLDSVSLLGLNCGAESRRDEHTGMPYAINGMHQLSAALEERGITSKRMMTHPNAGKAILDKDHNTFYAQSPSDMASYLPDLLDAGAFMVGGCCGTGPEHIKAFRAVVDQRINSGTGT